MSVSFPMSKNISENVRRPSEAALDEKAAYHTSQDDNGAGGLAGPPAALSRRESWTLRLYNPALADRLGFLHTAKDDLARGLAGRRLTLV